MQPKQADLSDVADFKKSAKRSGQEETNFQAASRFFSVLDLLDSGMREKRERELFSWSILPRML